MKSVPVSSTCEIILSGTPNTSVPEYWNGEIKWATAKDVAECSERFIKNTEKTITALGVKNSAAKILPRGTIIISARGTVGKICIMNQDMSCNQSCYGLIPKKDVIRNLFLYYSLKNLSYSALAYGTVFDTITIKTFDELMLDLPELHIQDKILNHISKLDDLIELRQDQNKKLEKIIDSIFKSWFIDFDGQTEFIDSEFGEIPKRWIVKQLDQIAVFLNGLALQNFRPTNNDFLPVIKIREMKNGITSDSEKARIDLDDKYVVNDGDVLFSWSGSLELMIWCGGKGALNQHIFKVTSSEFQKWFYYQWIKFHLEKFRRIADDKATTMGHIQRHHLSEALVLIPPNDVLNKINNMSNPIFELIINNKIQIFNLQKIRDILIPKLISGEIQI